MDGDGAVRSAKRALRSALLANRAQRTPADRDRAATALAGRMGTLPEVARAGRVACYVSTSGEPDTGPLVATLLGRGCEVLLPVLQPDFDLDWAPFAPDALRAARFGLLEPTGRPLGAVAVAEADVVICPGLAADAAGHRLGRGGGSYDRALARVGPAILRVVLLYDDEVLPAVPVDEHDEPVDVIVTPDRVIRATPDAG